MNFKAERIDVRTTLATLTLMLAIAGATPALAEKVTRQPAPAKPGTPGTCITRPQLEALITYALPALIDGVADKCSATLAPDSFLTRSGPGLAQRYRAESDRHWPMARSAVASMAGEELGRLGEATQKTMVSTLVGAAISEAIKPKDCPAVNEAVELLSPLPADNLGRLTAMLAILGSKDDKPGESPFPICPAPGAP
ncbi:hypothetical protein ACFB49_11180 [Sphingomonas sp. DBB INV C78]|uniref:hypothetical protein n=1 Tax=Sphingomonas sp. DBB INV C78 TaxID=3349434 RepID=UPI0036D42149